MPDTATVAYEWKNNFFESVKASFAADVATENVLVSFGQPGTFEPDDIVSFERVTERQDPATMGTNRSREEVLTLDVIISCYRGGGPEQEQVCSARAYDLLRRIEIYARKTDTTIGGAVRHCFLQSHESDGATLPELIAQGRTIDITATFEARARITG
ncbi:hypothetical protein ACX80O_02355 [Arthrobacter sp. Hz1]